MNSCSESDYNPLIDDGNTTDTTSYVSTSEIHASNRELVKESVNTEVVPEVILVTNQNTLNSDIKTTKNTSERKRVKKKKKRGSGLPYTSESRPFLDILFAFTSPTVQCLLGWKHGSKEMKFMERAVELLISKLETRKGAIEELVKALSYPETPSKCITIPRSVDGRMKIAECVARPHVIFCRIWRWPDLQSYLDLTPLELCQYPDQVHKRQICINPYHYRRVNYSK